MNIREIGAFEAKARLSELLEHDPFDRLLAAQALVERLVIVSRDRVLRKYGVDVVW